MKRRNDKRTQLSKKWKERRAEWRKIVNSPDTTQEQKLEAQKKLQETKHASKAGVVNRCPITGRARGYYRAVGLCRNMFRKLVMSGYVPGFTKASW